MNTEIIIVKYKNKKLEDRCVRSVLDYTDIAYHLTVYNNYPRNEGLSVVWNRLIEKSNAKYICLLNSDTVVERGWLEVLRAALEKYDAVGPVSNNAGYRQTRPRGLGVEDTEMLSGFCLMFKKSVWRRVGSFNEKLPFYFGDDDFSMRLRSNGFRLGIVKDVFIHHEQRGTAGYSKEMKEIFDKGKEHFEKEWGIKWTPKKYLWSTEQDQKK